MFNQVKALKDGKSVDKPIYNHVTGKLDAPEKIDSPQILVPARFDRPVPSPSSHTSPMLCARGRQ